MSFKLLFLPQALKEWKKLPPNVQEQFKTKLEKCLKQPIVPKNHLRGDLKDCYKIKLRTVGYRLVYQLRVEAEELIVITVGKRDKNMVYKLAQERFKH